MSFGEFINTRSPIRDFANGQLEALDMFNLEQVGIGDFTLFARVKESVAYTSQIPVNVLEDGSTASDQIINAPVTIDIEGEVSDVFILRDNLTQLQTLVTAQVGNISKYLPGRTQAQLSKVNGLLNDAQDKVSQIDQAIADGKQAYEFFGNKGGGEEKGLREKFLDYVEAVHYGKQLISVQTLYRLHENMGVESLVIQRDNMTDVITFKASFKKVRFSAIEFAELDRYFKKPAPAQEPKTTGKADKGAQAPKKEKSVLQWIKETAGELF